MSWKQRDDMNPFWFRKSNQIPPRPKRVLMIHPFGIGDGLFITPILRALKEHGVKRVDLLLGSRTRELFEFNPYVDEIFEWDKSPVVGFRQKWNRWRKLMELSAKLRKVRYDAAFDFSPTGHYAFMSFLFFWIPIRIGFNFKNRGLLLTHKQELPNGYVDRSVVEYYLGLLKFLGISPRSNQSELFLSETDQMTAQEILRKYHLSDGVPFLAVAPGGGESWGKDARLKRWPVRHFAKLIQELRSRYPLAFEKVLIFGGQNERFLGDQLLEELSGIAADNLCGSLSIRQAAALIKRAAVLIGNDGGLLHIAHAVGTPVIGIFGPVDSVVYGPYPPGLKVMTVSNEGPACRPCYQRFRYQAACQGIECLSRLLPERILNEICLRNFFNQPSLSALPK